MVEGANPSPSSFSQTLESNDPMSQKSIASVLFLIAAALGGPFAVDHAIDVQKQVETSIEITGPTEVAVGELVELKINGSRPSWLAPTADARSLEDTLYLSFRDEGEYEVIGSAIAGAKTSTVRHEINVSRDQSVLVDDEPEVAPDEPTVDVEPVPVPVPEPVVKSDLSALVVEWCEDSNAPKVGCKKLGTNFIDAATDATSIDDLLSKVSAANRRINQKGCEQVLAQIQQYLFDNLQGEDLEAHRCAFDEIGTGLIRYSGTEIGATGSYQGLWK